MRAKSIAIFLTVVTALIGVSLFQVDRALFSDQVSAGEATSRSQMAALIPAFQSEFKSFTEHFKFAGPVALVRPADFDDNISNRFEMVARLQDSANGWTVAEKTFHTKTKVKSWAENYTSIALKAIKPRDLPLGGTALTALLDPQRRPFFLWIMRDENNNWWAAITKANVFQGIIDRQRGQTSSVFLVNKQGQALGHTTAAYLGTILKDSPVVQDVIKGTKRSGVGLYQDPDGGELQGFYELIPGTNVSVVLTRPMTALADSRQSLRWQLLLLGGGLALLGLAAILLFVKDTPRAPGASAPGALPMYGAGSVGVSVPSPTISVPAAAASAPAASLTLDQKAELVRERSRAYTTAASALAREMHGPLTRILSHAQILKGKSVREPELDRIEELARDGRAVVQKLLSFSGEEDFKPEPTSINEALTRTLGLFEAKFQQKGIKVEKNLKRMPEIQAHPLGLMKVFEAVLNNAVEAMERMPKKILQIDLDADGAFAVLKIKDSGEGVPTAQANQVFDPFFTTKSPSVHSGLGLATAFGLTREFGGELKFESSMGQGATVIFRFPIGAQAVAAPASAPPKPAVPVPSASAPSMAPPGPTSGLALSKQMPDLINLGDAADPFAASERLPHPPVGKPAVKPAAPPPAAPPPALRSGKPAAPPVRNLILPTDDQFDLELSGELAPATPPPSSEAEDSLIPNQVIEQTLSMIDDVDAPVTRAPADPRIDPPPVRSPAMTAGGKLDKPSFGPKKPPPKAAPVQIRRPGERK